MAGTLQYVGFETLNFGPIEVHSGPTGCVCRFTVQCPILNPLIDYYNYIIGFGASVKFVGLDRGQERMMEIEVPGLINNLGTIIAELFFDRWELLTNEEHDSIFENPIITNFLNYNDKTVLGRMVSIGGTVSDAISSCNNDIGERGLAAPNPVTGGTADGKFGKVADDGRIRQLVIEVAKGQTEFSRPKRVLRHTSYCSPGATYNSSRSNEDKLYTVAQLLTEVGTGWTYNLPSRLYTEISSFPIDFVPTDEASYYLWSWRKIKSRENQLANFMIEVSTEYWLNNWSVLRYALR